MFYSLQNYSTYSIFSGLMNPDKWIERADELGYKALGLCDKQVFSGAIEWQKLCKEHGIVPILGEEFLYVEDCDSKKKYKANINIYIKNKKGLENLIFLNNFSQDKKKGFYYRPRIDNNILSKNKEGLICVLSQNQDKGIKDKDVLSSSIDLYNIFENDFYVGLNPYQEEKDINSKFKNIKYNKVLTFNCHYPIENNKSLYKVVRKIDKRSGRGMDKNLDREIENGCLPRKDRSQFSSDYKECFKGLEQIYNKCKDFSIPTDTYHMPNIDIRFDSVREEILYLIGEGFKEKLYPEADFDKLEDIDDLYKWGDKNPYEHINKGEDPESLKNLEYYIDRLKYEFNVIDSMDYLDYFYVIWDICRFADTQPEGRGPARGSAASSLFSYLLNITRIDPIRHGMIFERFLNKDRNDLPDIDMDFSSTLRDKIKDYLRDKYGKDNVCVIGTFDRFKIASAVKDVARAYGYGIPNNDGEIIEYDSYKLDDIFSNQFVPQTARGKRELQARLGYSNFKEFYERHEKWFNKIIMPLQNSVKNISIHAAGCIVTPEPIDKTVPVFNRSGKLISQWQDSDCESRGFPKFDILSIKAIDIIDHINKLLEKEGEDRLPEYEQIPLDDEDTMKIFRNIKTDGVFQFKSFVQHEYLPRLKPDTFEELVAATSLRRPGPESAGADQDYIDIKFNRKSPSFEHPDMKPITEWTKGLIIYQEQLMRICTDIAGMTRSEADHVRKACGKKKIKKMREWEAEFKEGVIENGYSSDLAENLWDKIVAFSEYGFNIAHSTSYTLIGYYHAWIKSRHPVKFWCAALKHAKTDKRDYESVWNLKERAQREGIEFVYPTIYGFASDFEPAGENKIYWPILGISGIGDKTAREITDNGNREAFDDMREMMKACDSRIVNKGIYNTLIEAGFFKPIYDKPWRAAQRYYKLREEIQGYKDKIPYKLSHKNLFKWYKRRNEAFDMIVQSWKDIAPFHDNIQIFSKDQFKSIEDGEKVFIGGYIEDMTIKQISTRPDELWAKLKIVDLDEEYTVMCWPPFWMNKDLDIDDNRPEVGQLVELIGEKDSWKDRPQVTIGKPNNYLRTVWDEESFEEDNDVYN